MPVAQTQVGSHRVLMIAHGPPFSVQLLVRIFANGAIT